MFKRANRLTKNKEIEKVFQQGKAFYTDILGLKIVANGLAKNRITVIVSTKVNKKAVVRNKIKRQIRAILIQELDQMKPGYDIIVICLPLIIDKSFEDIKASLQKTALKLGLI